MVFHEDESWWNTLKELMLLKAASGGLTEYEAEGNPVSFQTNVSKPLSQMLIPFTPVQSGTGDPSPDNIRPITGWTGVNISHTPMNILPKTMPSDAFAGAFGTGDSTIGSASNARCFCFYVGKNKSLVYRINTSSSMLFAFADNKLTSRNGAVIYDAINCSSRTSYTLNSGEHPWLVVSSSRENTYNNNVASLGASVYFWAGSTIEDYDAIDWSPIPVTFPAMGKNLFNEDDPKGTFGKFINSTYELTDNTRGFTSDKIRIKADSYYAFSRASVAPSNAYLMQYDEDGEVVARANIAIGTNVSATIKTNASAAYGVITLLCASGTTMSSTVLESMQIQMEEGNSATTYEEFNNTVYGGTLDLTTGVLTVEWANIDVASLERYRWNKSSSYPGGYFYKWSYVDLPSNTDFICSHAKRVYSISEYNNGTCFSDTSLNIRILSSESVLQDWFDYLDEQKLAGTPVQAVCELSTPLEFQLTPQQITTLIGDNVIFSDTNGENTITYLKKG